MPSNTVHYFPGHMNKAIEKIKSFMKTVDMVVEIVDGRAPLSSRNPILDTLVGSKPRLILLSKSDMADPNATKEWVSFFASKGIVSFSSDLKKDKLINVLTTSSAPLVAVKREKEKKMGMKPQPVRIMVIGVPNVGKSTFINNIAHRKAAVVGNKAGVTRSEQWIKLNEAFTLLDTPGVLPMNYLDKSQAIRLAILGTMKEEILPTDLLADELLAYLRNDYPSLLKGRFGLEDISKMDNHEILEAIAKKRGLLEGNNPSKEKAAYLLIKEFKDGILGRCSIEKVQNA
ncbi:MAG: ribosome biogenesis GTPase YlqF [Bacilli bacterium]|nr:ribosome biogenesis GTPase YlqF [Bacilli bacterium]